MSFSSPGLCQNAPTIRSINIEVRDVFEGPKLPWIYRLANAVKINSREQVIRRELLFKEGEVWDEFLVAESERALRSLGIIRQVSIIPVQDGKHIDVLVSVQDTWTLFPELGFTSGGGTDRLSLGLVERNTLGFGKRFEVLYANDEDRDLIQGVWDDPRLFGTYHRLALGRFERSDGYRMVTVLGRPYRSLVDPYSWESNTEFFNLVGRLFENGDERYIFRQNRQFFTIGPSLSAGIPEKNIRRYTVGYEFLFDRFSLASDQDFDDIGLDPDDDLREPALLPEDRKFSGPFFSFNQVIPEFISVNYIDRFDRIEDFNLGNEFSTKLHLAADAFGSEEDTLIYFFRNGRGARFSPTSFIRGAISLQGRVADDGFENSIASLEARYYNVLGAKYLSDVYLGRHTLAAAITTNYGYDLDGDVEFLLGADRGIRAYADRTFSGSSDLFASVEDRFVLYEELFQLISVGGSFFLDAGATSNKNPFEGVAKRLHSNMGFGLRLNFPRSSGGSVVRIDVAFPLRDGPDGSSQFEPRLLVSTGQFFGARLRGEGGVRIQTQGSFAGS